jgi:4'-phosphopantetheinyl transferase
VTAAVRALDVSAIAPGDWPALAALLNEEERARAARFVFDEDRHAYIAAHALLRVELSRRAGGHPRLWRFAPAPRGKPHLIDAPRDLRFSLSHTRGMVAVALAEGVDVGVDVERSDRRADNMKLAARFFASEEVAALQSLAEEARRETFFSVWACKEAVVKATGEGLARALDSFAVTLDPPGLAFRDAGPAPDWSLAHWRRGPCHFAFAARAAGVAPDVADARAAALLAAV